LSSLALSRISCSYRACLGCLQPFLAHAHAPLTRAPLNSRSYAAENRRLSTAVAAAAAEGERLRAEAAERAADNRRLATQAAEQKAAATDARGLSRALQAQVGGPLHKQRFLRSLKCKDMLKRTVQLPRRAKAVAS